MSTGLDCWIAEAPDGSWSFGIEDPSSDRFDPEYVVEGPFPTLEAMIRAYRRHPNPGGFSLELHKTTHDEFDRIWDGVR